MKYVTITFDDGRDDNYKYAAPILEKWALPATLFCTTGFIDGTWKKPLDSWRSVNAPLSVNNIKELKTQGWEIGLHGDKHITELNDWKDAISKITNWNFFEDRIAFSLPDSGVNIEALQEIKQSEIASKISFIRQGRGINTKKLSKRVLYFLYTYMKVQWGYNMFNKPSCNSVNSNLSTQLISSVVVKRQDLPQMILKFIEFVPENNWIVFMFHSILPADNKLYKADNWTWSDSNFDCFASGLFRLQNQREIQVINMKEMYGRLNGNDK